MRLRPRRAGELGYLFLFTRAELRRHWRSLLVLAVIAAATVGTTVAMLASAARSETAFQRLRAATHASDVVVFYPNTRNDPAAAVAAVKGIEGVEAGAAEAELFLRPAGTALFPDYNLYPIAPLVPQSADAVNTPVIVKGRRVDPRRVDEVALSEALAAELAVRVGETITLESMTAHWVDLANNGGDPGPPDGPRVKVRVVGLTRTPADFGRLKGVIYLSPAFIERYGRQLDVRAAVYARLSAAAVRQAKSGSLPGLRGIETGASPFGDDAATNDGLATVATALRLVAGVVALAGATAIVVIIARRAQLVLRDRATLVALGWSKRRLVDAAIVIFAPWMLAGVGLGVVGGVFASRLAMVSLARSVDPAPTSIVIDSNLVVGAIVVGFAVGLCLVVVGARRAVQPPTSSSHRRVPGIQLGRPLPAVLGIRYAVFGDAGGASRGALAVIGAGVAAAVAALAVSASIGRLQTDPTLIGQARGRVIDSGESLDLYDRVLPLLEKDKRVAMLAGIHVIFGISTDKGDALTALAYDIKRGDIGASVVRGRTALSLDEVAMGPATLEHLGKEVGDVVTLRGGDRTASYRIVGSMLFPEGDFTYDDGVAFTAIGAERLFVSAHDAGQLHQVAFEWADGVDADAADKQLAAHGALVLTNDMGLKPAPVKNLGEVKTIPRYVAIFFGLLCLIVLGQLLASNMRRRSRELGTLRALGMTASASSLIIAAHALTIAGIAVAVGLPLGLVAGNQIWTPIANSAHVVVRTVAPWSSIAVLLLVAVAGTALLTAMPAWRASRLRPAETLRAE
ncbi:MAG: ABC transporter permease [Acidimicrobiales bacterium]